MKSLLKLISIGLAAHLLTGCVSSPTVTAMMSDDFEAFKAEISREKDINVPYRDLTFLMWAASEGKMEVASYLIQRGADLNTRDSFGYTALFWALFRGKEDMARLLIDKGADIHTTDIQGNTSLIMAAGLGSLPLVKTLAEKGVDVNKADSRGNTPLIMAVGDGNTGMARYLIEKGAKVDVRDADGLSLLMIALKFNRFDLAKVLLQEKQIDVNLKDNKGNTALFYAIMPGTIDPFVENTELVKGLIERGAVVNVQNGQGCTPLMIAAMCGAVDTVGLLLKNGAEKGVKNKDAKTASFFVDRNNGEVSFYEYLPKDDGYLRYTIWTKRENHPEIARLLK